MLSLLFFVFSVRDPHKRLVHSANAGCGGGFTVGAEGAGILGASCLLQVSRFGLVRTPFVLATASKHACARLRVDIYIIILPVASYACFVLPVAREEERTDPC